MRLGSAVLVLAALALLASQAAGAPRRAPPPLPDPAISAVTIEPKVAFKGEPASVFRFCDRTTNLGRGKTPRRLHNFMELVGPGVRAVVARRDTPKLPGTVRPRRPRNAPPIQFSHRGCGRGENDPLNVPPGRYDVRVCADVRLAQRTLANNCVRFRKSVSVVKRTWSATLNGNGPFLFGGPDTEKWNSNGAIFTLTGRPAPGRFVYTMSGSVSYSSVFPPEAGCARSGAQTDFSPTGTLTIDYAAETYLAFGRTSAGFGYPVVGECDPAQGPSHPVFLDTGIGTVGPRPLPFGTDVITGTYTSASETTHNWTFQ
jgi:hypothetical protein